MTLPVYKRPSGEWIPPDTVRILVERIKAKAPLPRRSMTDGEWLRKSTSGF
jgi:hypothetical protein